MVCGNITWCLNSCHVCDYLCVCRRDFCIICIGSYFCITLGRGVLINVNYEFLDSHRSYLILRGPVPEALWGRFVQMRYQCNYLLALLFSCCFSWPCLSERERERERVRERERKRERGERERERESLYIVTDTVSVTYICCWENNKAVAFYYCSLCCMYSMYPNM